MSDLSIGIISILVFLCSFMIVHLAHDRQLKYNCSVVEISPDIPTDIKQQCRELREKSGRI